MFKESEAKFHALEQQLSAAAICPKCESTLPNERALRLHTINNFAYCQGKCQECKASDSPCDLTGSTGPCSRCATSEKACHLEQTTRQKQPSQQCSEYLWRYASRHYGMHNKEDCIGRCERCEERNLPCRIFSGKDDCNEFLKGKSECYFCLLSNEECVRGPIEGSSLSDNESDDDQMDTGSLEAGEMDENAMDQDATDEDIMNEDAMDDNAMDEDTIDETLID